MGMKDSYWPERVKRRKADQKAKSIAKGSAEGSENARLWKSQPTKSVENYPENRK